jgi:hypothetical protein
MVWLVAALLQVHVPPSLRNDEELALMHCPEYLAALTHMHLVITCMHLRAWFEAFTFLQACLAACC